MYPPSHLTNKDTPDQRLSKDSSEPKSPTGGFSSVAFSTGSGKVGRKMISKMKIGGKKIGAATKNTIDKLGSSGESGNRHSGDGSGSPIQHVSSPNYSSNKRASGSHASLGSPGRSDGAGFKPDTVRDLETKDEGGGGYGYNDGQPVGLGLSAPTRPYAAEAVPQSPSSFSSFSQIQSPQSARPSPSYPPVSQRPQSPMSPSAGTVISRKEGKGQGRHGFSASISSGKVSKFFKTDPKSKHQSDGYSPPQGSTSPKQNSTSPKQKSKFSKFIGDLSQQGITGTRPSHSSSPSVGSSPPLPPDKTQFRSTSAMSGRPYTAGSPEPLAPVAEDRPSGFKGFISDLGKRDITGTTADTRLAATRKREQEQAQYARPVQYDDSASDWEVKMGQMEDVLPHIRRDILAEALIQAGGDEQRAIGLAVLNSRG
jgi:hypothetical protein